MKTIKSGNTSMKYDEEFFKRLEDALLDQINETIKEKMNEAIDERMVAIQKDFPVKTGKAKAGFEKEQRSRLSGDSLIIEVAITNKVPYVPLIHIEGKKTRVVNKLIRTPLQKKYRKIINELQSELKSDLGKVKVK